MSNAIEFTVGGKYENVKGVYEVLSIDYAKDTMDIRWESGEQTDTSIKFQKKIIRRLALQKKMKDEAKIKKPAKKSKPKSLGSKFNGLVESDFKNNVTGTTWRSRSALGGEVTKRLFSKEYNFVSNAVYRVPMIQWADEELRKKTDVSYQAKLYVQVYEEYLRYGFYIEKQNSEVKEITDWERLLEWLKEDDNAKWLTKTVETNKLSIILEEWADDETKLSETVCNVIDKNWIIDGQKITSIGKYFRELNPTIWVGVFICAEMSKETAVSKDKEIAQDISGLFEILMPLYESSCTSL